MNIRALTLYIIVNNIQHNIIISSTAKKGDSFKLELKFKTSASMADKADDTESTEPAAEWMSGKWVRSFHAIIFVYHYIYT